jgi:hypothetical protein
MRDVRFVRQLAILLRCRTSGEGNRALLDGCTIEVVDYRSDAGFEVHVSDARGRLIGLGYVAGRAFIVPAYTVPALRVSVDEDRLSLLVTRLLRRLNAIDLNGHSTQRRSA